MQVGSEMGRGVGERRRVLLGATAISLFCVSVEPAAQPAPASDGSASGDRAGWSAGAGLEWMVVPGWSLKAEYLHYDLGTFVCGAGTCVAGQPVNVRFAFDTGKVGINYHFYSGPAIGW
jgi:outer membrane immunogenic protein